MPNCIQDVIPGKRSATRNPFPFLDSRLPPSSED